MISINKFYKNYLKSLFTAINKINIKNIDTAAELILKTIVNKKKILVCGNGGSAAISNHYVCDYLKFFRSNTNLKPVIISLSNNIETISAIANDIAFEKIFSYQAESICENGDLIIIVSSSGNSKNIKHLIKFAKQKKIKVIGFSGFKGGYLNLNANISIHVKAENYGISEDSHHILMHIILQYLIYMVKKKN